MLCSVTVPVRLKRVCFSANLHTIGSVFYAKFSIPEGAKFSHFKETTNFHIIFYNSHEIMINEYRLFYQMSLFS